MTLYKNKYRIESARLKGWDYASVGNYFITICTKNRECLFGGINIMPTVKTQCIASLRIPIPTPISSPVYEMKLNDIGKIANNEWLKTFDMRPDMNLTMDEFVIMPNHFHAIISIGENQYNTEESINQFKPQSKNLASIIRGFKIGVTINAHKINPYFAWQPRFHDRVIRNENELNRIREYIINNPQNWTKDDHNISEASK